MIVNVLDAAEFMSMPVEQPDFYFETLNGKEWLTIKWGGYEYDIEMNRIETPLDLLSWLHHFCEKSWSGMTFWQFRLLIESVAEKRGWKLYGV